MLALQISSHKNADGRMCSPAILRKKTALVGLFLVLLLTSCASSEKWKPTLEKADALSKAGERASAIKYYYQGLGEMEQARASKDAQLTVLGKLIALEHKDNNAQAMQKLCQKALPMADITYGPDSLKLLPFLAEARDAHSRLSEREKAAAMLDRIISIQEKNSGSDSAQLMWFLEDYAKSTSPTCGDRFDVSKLRHLLRLRAKYSGESNPDSIRDKLVLADVLGQQEASQKEAEQLYLECIKSAKAPGTPPGLMSNCILRYARFMRITKRPADALPLLQVAYAASGPGGNYSRLMGPDIADLLGDALEHKGKTKEAKAIYAAMVAQLSNEKTHPMYAEFFERYESLKK